MPSPFPGMNPYLGQGELWQDFHLEFLPAMRRQLVAQVGPDYIVKLEEHLFQPQLCIMPESPSAGRIARHGSSSRTATSSGSSATVVLPLVQDMLLPRTSSRLAAAVFMLSVIVVSRRSVLSLKMVR